MITRPADLLSAVAVIVVVPVATAVMRPDASTVAILASASMLVILTGSYPAFRRVNPVALIDVAEGTGISSYPVIGSIGLLAGSAFLTNVLPLGEPGQLVSGGMLPLLNLGVGLAVSAGLVLIVSEFLEQTFAIRTRGG